MKKNHHSAALSAEMDRIEVLISEHGPHTVLGLSMLMGISKDMVIRRVDLLISAKRLHISYRGVDPLSHGVVTKNSFPSSYYALGPDPERGLKPYRPVVKEWSAASVNGDPLHAAFFGRVA